MTPDGLVAVENIRAGDKLWTQEGTRPVLWVGSARIRFDDARNDHLRPVRFRPNSLGPGIPNSDVWVSPQHRVHCQHPEYEVLFGVDSVLVPAKYLTSQSGIDVDEKMSSVEYFHILLVNHHILDANGMLAESLLFSEWAQSQSTLKATGEFEEIFASCKDQSARTCFPVLKRYEASLLQT